jgi:hypothetical protein
VAKSKAFKPSSLCAYERFEALMPMLSEASEAYFRLCSEAPSKQRDDEVKATLDDCFARVAGRSEMSVEEVNRAFHGFMALGMPGLMCPVPLNAERIADTFIGRWELHSRFTNGGNTPHARDNARTRARSHIYYERTGDDPTALKALITMWTAENHYPREEALKRYFASSDDTEAETFFIAALIDIRLRQVDDYTLEYTDDGEVIGNFGDFLRPTQVRSHVTMMRFESAEATIGIPETNVVIEGREQPAPPTMFVVLGVHGAPRTLAFPMSGLPPLRGDMRSMDTVDTYMKVGDQQPLVAGWEPIESYYKRLRDPIAFADSMRERAGDDGVVHGFHPDSMSVLQSFDLLT